MAINALFSYNSLTNNVDKFFLHRILHERVFL